MAELSRAEFSRYDELRLKTEAQLVQLIHHELDRAMRDPRRAQRAHAEVSRLMRLTAETTEDERSKLESRLRDLAEVLEPAKSLPVNLYSKGHFRFQIGLNVAACPPCCS
jgi:hypothetical protein